MKKLLLVNTSPQDFWKFPSQLKASLTKSLPSGWEVVEANDMPTASKIMKEAAAIMGFSFPKHLVRGNKELRWVHFLNAQVPLSWQDMKNEGVLVTGSSGVSSSSVGEHALYLALKGLRREGFKANHQEWNTESFGIARAPSRLKAGIIGSGVIALRIHQLVSPLFKDVTLLSHHCRAIEGVSMQDYSHAASFYSQSDVIVMATSLNQESAQDFRGDKFFSKLKPDAILVNVARGELFEEQELVNFLKANPQAQYLSDVALPEPYPTEGPLYQLPNSFLSPHVAARHEDVWEGLVAKASSSLKEFLEQP